MARPAPMGSRLDRRRLSLLLLLVVASVVCAIALSRGDRAPVAVPLAVAEEAAVPTVASALSADEPEEPSPARREALPAAAAAATCEFVAVDVATGSPVSGVVIRVTPIELPEDVPAPDLDRMEASPGVSYASLGVAAHELRRPFDVPAASANAPPPPPAVLETDAGGAVRYTYSTEPRCGWLIQVHHPAWHALRSSQWLRELPARASVPMAARLDLTVAVLDARGAPVEGALVSLVWPALPHAFYWRNLSTAALGRTDDRGLAVSRLGQDLAAETHVAVGHPDHAPAVVALPLDDVAAGRLRVDIRLEQGCTWYCRVVDGAGRPVPACSVQLVSKSTLLEDWDPDFMPPVLARRYGLQRSNATTDASGVAAVHGWPRGAAARLMLGTATARLRPLAATHGDVELVMAAGDDEVWGVDCRPAPGAEVLVQVEVDRPPEIHVHGVVRAPVPAAASADAADAAGALHRLLAGSVVRVHLIWDEAPRSTAFARLRSDGSFACTLPVPRMLNAQVHVALQHLDRPEVKFGPYTVREGMSIGSLVLPD